MQTARTYGLALAVALGCWYAVGIGCQWPRVAPRNFPSPPPVEAKPVQPDFPSNMERAIPVGTSLALAKSLLFEKGFTAGHEWIDSPETGLIVWQATLDKSIGPLVTQTSQVLLYHDGQMVKKVETKEWGTGP